MASASVSLKSPFSSAGTCHGLMYVSISPASTGMGSTAYESERELGEVVGRETALGHRVRLDVLELDTLVLGDNVLDARARVALELLSARETVSPWLRSARRRSTRGARPGYASQF